jgi:hypothetical protein
VNKNTEVSHLERCLAAELNGDDCLEVLADRFLNNALADLTQFRNAAEPSPPVASQVDWQCKINSNNVPPASLVARAKFRAQERKKRGFDAVRALGLR